MRDEARIQTNLTMFLTMLLLDWFARAGRDFKRVARFIDADKSGDLTEDEWSNFITAADADLLHTNPTAAEDMASAQMPSVDDGAAGFKNPISGGMET